MTDYQPLRAALPMYDWPELTAATNQLWSLINKVLRDADLDAPEHLTRDVAYNVLWCEPDCVFSQTCSRPFVNGVEKHVYPLATPSYAATGCHGIMNASQIVCRTNDARQSFAEFEKSTVICNSEDSQSGFHSLRAFLIKHQLRGPFFDNTVISGSHRESIKQVVAGNADIAAIDPVSWQLAIRFDPDLVNSLRVLDETPRVPGLPFIISRQLIDEQGAASLSMVLLELLHNLPQSLKTELLIAGGGMASAEDYEFVRQIDSRAIKAGHGRFSKKQINRLIS